MNNLQKLSDEQLLKHVEKRMPEYRKLLARLRGFMQLLGSKLGGVFKANASSFADVEVIDVNGEGGSIHVKEFKAPNFKTLKRHLNVLAESDTIDELEYITERLQRSDSAAVRTKAKQLVGVLNALVVDYNEAFDAVEAIANKHIPASVAAYFDEANKELLSFLKTTTDSKVNLAPTIHVGSEDSKVVFACYHKLTEYANSPTWIVFSASLEVNDTSATFFRELTVLDKYIAPTLFTPDVLPKGVHFGIHLRRQLAAHGVAKLTSSIGFDVDESRVTKELKKLAFVTGVTFEDGEIAVRIRKEKRSDKDLVKDVFTLLVATPEVRSAMRKKKARLDYEFNEETGSWVFRLVG